MSRSSSPDVPPEAWIVALASLPEVGPTRLDALVSGGEPAAVWADVVACRAHRYLGDTRVGDPLRLAEKWSRAARAIDPIQLWERHRDAGIGVSVQGSPTYPSVFAEDPEPPVALFHRGDPDSVAGPRVAIIGTRDCTRYGYDLAFELGRDLAAAGVRVVSGLALGIDGAAHAGALDAASAPPIAVVGSGLDVIYPRRNGPLWRAVLRSGVMFSEYPMGVPAHAWHFPARNRLIAGLADIVVVVESHETGGSMLTVEEAVRRDRNVLAVPGPVRCEASKGSNALLFDGHGVARDAGDILEGLGLLWATSARSVESRPDPEPFDRLVLEAMGWQATTADRLALLVEGASMGTVGLALDRLEEQGWVAVRASWFERVARPGG